MALPTTIGTCLITWKAMKAIIDSADPDRDPDSIGTSVLHRVDLSGGFSTGTYRNPPDFWSGFSAA